MTSRLSPRASSAERIASSPHNSPCAPALGLIATLCMPVRRISHSPSSWISCSAPCTVSTGCSGWMSAKPAAAPPSRTAADCASSCSCRAGTGRGRSHNSGATGGCSGAPSRARTGRRGRSARLRARPPRRRRRPARVEVDAGGPVSPISNSSGSSSISARLPVQVLGANAFAASGRVGPPSRFMLMPAPPASARPRRDILLRSTVSVTATTRPLASARLARIEPAERDAAQHACFGQRAHHRPRFLRQLQRELVEEGAVDQLDARDRGPAARPAATRRRG